MKKVIIIGGGAAGFFSAINIAEKHPDYDVTILEKTSKLLSKVKVSGGGRCNVTHNEFNIRPFSKNYPRGEKQAYKLFHDFQAKDTIAWFEKRGIKTKTEADGRMFPVSDSSQTIIDCFLKEAQRLNIKIYKSEEVTFLEKKDLWNVITKHNTYKADSIVISTGSVKGMWDLLSGLGHTSEPPVPSLFTFKIKDTRISDLPGVAFKKVSLKVAGTKLQAEGPLLITHWGLSGPATLRLSAWGAKQLAEKEYLFQLNINLVGHSFEATQTILKETATNNHKKQLSNTVPLELPKRYWLSILNHLSINEHRWCDIGSKTINKLSEELTNAQFKVEGKSTNKEEFVTCGGISWNEIDQKTMESNVLPNVYFAGEVINIDAITGGFNFQNAWTTAWVVSKNI